MIDIKTKHQKYVMNNYAFRGKTFVRGEGMNLYDEDGKSYLDCMSNYGVNIFGYNHPTIIKALQNQLEVLPNLHSSFANDVRAEAGYELVKRCGGRLTQVHFTNSGAEAVETALKFALLATGRNEVIAMENSYHGKTFGALSVMSNKKYRDRLDEFLWKTKFVPFGDIEILKQTISDKTALAILEPIQGESGIHVPPSDYLRQVQDLCQKHGVKMVVDEIQTGAGRTGHFLASHMYEITPDIVCLGKGIGGGIPIGAVLVTQDIVDRVPKFIATSTFGGNPLACRGILKVLRLLDVNMLAHINDTGNYFVDNLRKINNNLIVEVRGKGLMIGVEVSEKRNEILKKMQEMQVIATPAGENVVRFLPPYIITKKEVDTAIMTFKDALDHV